MVSRIQSLFFALIGMLWLIGRKKRLLKLSECEIVKVIVERGHGEIFLFGRSQVRLLGVGEVTFWVRSEGLT